jgi:hypothetical protein
MKKKTNITNSDWTTPYYNSAPFFHQFQLKPAIIPPNFQRLALFLSQSYFHYGPFAFNYRPHGLSVTLLLFLWFASIVLIRKAMESLGFSAEDLVLLPDINYSAPKIYLTFFLAS